MAVCFNQNYCRAFKISYSKDHDVMRMRIFKKKYDKKCSCITLNWSEMSYIKTITFVIFSKMFLSKKKLHADTGISLFNVITCNPKFSYKSAVCIFILTSQYLSDELIFV